MEELKNLSQLNPQVRKRLSPYLDELLKIHQENIVSILLCGQALGKDFIPNVSNIPSW